MILYPVGKINIFNQYFENYFEKYVKLKLIM